MTDFGWFQAAAFEKGKVACVICFDDKNKTDMEPVSTDPSKVWDVCKSCAEIEKIYGVIF